MENSCIYGFLAFFAHRLPQPPIFIGFFEKSFLVLPYRPKTRVLKAYHKASAGKRGRQSAAQFEHQLADHLLELQEVLRTFRYQPGPYHNFFIHKPKRRLISAAPFRDGVVHHARAM